MIQDQKMYAIVCTNVNVVPVKNVLIGFVRGEENAAAFCSHMNRISSISTTSDQVDYGFTEIKENIRKVPGETKCVFYVNFVYVNKFKKFTSQPVISGPGIYHDYATYDVDYSPAKYNGGVEIRVPVVVDLEEEYQNRGYVILKAKSRLAAWFNLHPELKEGTETEEKEKE